MVRLKHKKVAIRQGMANLRCWSSKIGRDTNSKTSTLIDDGDPHRVYCIVDGQEWLDSSVTHVERAPRVVGTHGFLAFKKLCACFLSTLCHVERGSVPSSVNSDTTRVITMFVRHHDRIDVFSLDSNCAQPLGKGAAAEACVD